MDNLAIWNQLSRPPKEYLRKISGGRLNGKTDISPQWRIKAMTEQFGMIGFGWGFEIKRDWTVPGDGGELLVFVEVGLWVKVDGIKSELIPGIGGNLLVEKESRGMHNNDEGYKMALTDALGVAMKALGVAADIYLGNWDGSKYRDYDPAPPPPKNPPKADGFASPPKTEPPKEQPKGKMVWSRATSAERRAYVENGLKAAVANNELAKIAKFMGDKGADFTPEDLAAVFAAMQQAEERITRECSEEKQ